MKRYRNASVVLPPALLAELQQYVAGEQLYVPRPAERRPWGEKTGLRAALRDRNAEIRREFEAGAKIDLLMQEFHLSYDSIRKIVAGKNRST